MHTLNITYEVGTHQGKKANIAQMRSAIQVLAARNSSKIINDKWLKKIPHQVRILILHFHNNEYKGTSLIILLELG